MAAVRGRHRKAPLSRRTVSFTPPFHYSETGEPSAPTVAIHGAPGCCITWWYIRAVGFQRLPRVKSSNAIRERSNLEKVACRPGTPHVRGWCAARRTTSEFRRGRFADQTRPESSSTIPVPSIHQVGLHENSIVANGDDTKSKCIWRPSAALGATTPTNSPIKKRVINMFLRAHN